MDSCSASVSKILSGLKIRDLIALALKRSLRWILKSGLIIFCALAILVLRWIFSLPEFDANYVGSYRGLELTMKGRILEPAHFIEITHLWQFEKWYEFSGRIQIYQTDAYDLNYGDIVEISGFLQDPFTADPRISAFVPQPEIHVLAPETGNFFFTRLLRLRTFFVGRLNKIFPEPASSLAAGLLLGVRSAIPKEILLDFKKTGLTHIIALSGFNIVILIAFITAVFSCFRRSVGAALSISLIVIFIALVGGGASIVRAGIMGVLALIARSFGRCSAGMRALFIAAYFMAVVDPFILIYDIGFQLSFAATAGLVVFSERFKKYFEILPNWIGMRENLIATCAAQIFTLPLIIFYFRGISLIAPVVNIIILPFIPILMLGSFLSLIFGKITAAPAAMLFQLMIDIVHFFAGLPFAFTELGIS